MLTRVPTGMPIADARDDFARARRAYLARRLLRGRRSRPRTLCDVAALPSGSPQLHVIHLDEIVGTVEPTKTFDGRHRVSVARALGHRDIDAWVA